ncbi:MAG: hypothetical protein NC412_01260 [Roseburia sp.]|nr:hypothetical protein [Roseburia sp.]MCM1277766.1 hypothetical protein [Robinsoniella sp.]
MDNQYMNYQPKPPNKFVTASLILGLLAFVTSMFLITPFIFGALSIIFAILSKNSKEKMSGSAIAGIWASIASMLGVVFMVGCVYYFMFNVPEFRELMNQQYEQMYGQSFDEMLEDMQNGTFDPNSLQPK